MPARGQLTLMHIRGIRIGVDYSWFFVLFLVIFWLSGFYREISGSSQSEFGPYALAVASALAFFASILLHELGHAIVAVRNGIPITDITLWLFGGVARMARDTTSPGVEFRVAIAGPLVTLAIAAACVVAGIAAAGPDDFWEAMLVREDAEISGPLAMVAWLAMINVLVLIFNLIPAFPLDGGRIARAVAWKVTGNRNRATRFAAVVGQGFSYAFIAIGTYLALFEEGMLVTGIWLAVIGFILAQSARGAAAQSAVSSRIESIVVGDVMDTEPVAIPEHTSVDRAIDEYFLRYRWPWFPVVDAGQRFQGLLVREAADAVPEPSRADRRVADVYETDGRGVLRVPVDAPLESLIGNDALHRLGGLAAVDAEGRLRGVITVDQVRRALRTALGPGG